MTKRLFFVAGEDSGDLLAAEVIREMRSLDDQVEVYGYGGPRMAQAGASIQFQLTDLASVGADWIGQVFKLRRLGIDAIKYCKSESIGTIVLVDYPGFNLRLATAAKRAGLQVIYYVCPQVWAWRTGRVKRMRRDIDLVLALFPFEEDFLRTHGVPVRFVGHPLIDRLRDPRPVQEIRQDHGLPSSLDIPLIGLLPGSRQKEVERLGPVLARTASLLLEARPNLHFVVPKAESVSESSIREHFPAQFPWTLVENPTPDLRSAFRASITKSGTSTLENAVLGVPQVIVYRGSPLVAWVARRVMRIPWLGLVNVLANREVCPEFLQERCIPERIREGMLTLIDETAERERMLSDMAAISESLGEGQAALRAAKSIMERITHDE